MVETRDKKHGHGRVCGNGLSSTLERDNSFVPKSHINEIPTTSNFGVEKSVPRHRSSLGIKGLSGLQKSSTNNFNSFYKLF